MRKRESRIPVAVLILVAFLLPVVGCNRTELQRLRDENARLRQQIAALQEGSGEIQLLKMDEFTVGLAASERDFDDSEFFQHLKTSLQDSTIGDSRFAISAEGDEQQMAKVRGMLVQQYLSEEKVPIRISNLAYKVKDPGTDFMIGRTVVPRNGITVERTADGLHRCTYGDTLTAQMDRDSAGQYSISYEDSTGGRGNIPLTLKDIEIFDPSQPPQSARQGDIAFNWQLSLEKIQVYRVSNFVGDVGSFTRKMRYPTTGLNQYQTIRDSVFLFGYGPYSTGLVNRMETPRFIDQVEVLPITPELVERLKVGISEEELSEVLRSYPGRWVNCTFVEFSESKKIWERPIAVGFPFLSRQISQEKDLVFYTKYDEKGPLLIGDYRIRVSRQ